MLGELQRQHTLLPTIAEVQNDPTLVRSDHLVLWTEVALDKYTSIKIITHNVLGVNSQNSGLHPADTYWETSEQAKERYAKMAKGFAAQKDLHVILLQEAQGDEIITALREALGASWQIVPTDIGLLSCYKLDELELINTSIEEQPYRRHKLGFQHKKINRRIDIHNFLGTDNAFPDKLERYIEQVLQSNHLIDHAFIIGNTKSRIAPVDNEPRNIVTAIVPQRFNQLNDAEPGVQVCDYPDGGFYRDPKLKIHQLNTRVLDFDTGELVEDKRTFAEAKLWPEFRMIICIDPEITTITTMLDYEAGLKKEVDDNNVLVRIAADSYNNKALAVRFSKKNEGLWNDLQAELKQVNNLQAREISSINADNIKELYPTIFIPLDNEELLHEAIVKYSLRGKLLNTVDSLIKSASRVTFYLRANPVKVKILQDLYVQIQDAPWGSTKDDFLKIIDEFLDKETECMYKGQKVKHKNLKILAAHRNIFLQESTTSKKTDCEAMLTSVIEFFAKPDDAPDIIVVLKDVQKKFQPMLENLKSCPNITDAINVLLTSSNSFTTEPPNWSAFTGNGFVYMLKEGLEALNDIVAALRKLIELSSVKNKENARMPAYLLKQIEETASAFYKVLHDISRWQVRDLHTKYDTDNEAEYFYRKAVKGMELILAGEIPEPRKAAEYDLIYYFLRKAADKGHPLADTSLMVTLNDQQLHLYRPQTLFEKFIMQIENCNVNDWSRINSDKSEKFDFNNRLEDGLTLYSVPKADYFVAQNQELLNKTIEKRLGSKWVTLIKSQ